MNFVDLTALKPFANVLIQFKNDIFLVFFLNIFDWSENSPLYVPKHKYIYEMIDS